MLWPLNACRMIDRVCDSSLLVWFGVLEFDGHLEEQRSHAQGHGVQLFKHLPVVVTGRE